MGLRRILKWVQVEIWQAPNFALSILLTGSLLGIMGVAVNLLFIAFHQMKINLISLLRASVKREFLSYNYFCRSGSDNNLLVTQSTN